MSSFAGIDPAMLRFDGIDATASTPPSKRTRAPTRRSSTPETLDYIAFASVGVLTGFELDPA